MYTDSFMVLVKNIKIFTKILQNMLKQDLTFQMLIQKDHWPEGKYKKDWTNE